MLSCHAKADYTEAKQFLDALMNSLGLKASVEEDNHKSFIDGRNGLIFVNGKSVGVIGEFNPEVISNFNLDMPISGFELNLDEVFKMIF